MGEGARGEGWEKNHLQSTPRDFEMPHPVLWKEKLGLHMIWCVLKSDISQQTVVPKICCLWLFINFFVVYQSSLLTISGIVLYFGIVLLDCFTIKEKYWFFYESVICWLLTLAGQKQKFTYKATVGFSSVFGMIKWARYLQNNFCSLGLGDWIIFAFL